MGEIRYGVVMAGGKATRFGEEKTMLEFRGKKLVDISCDAVSSMLKCIVAISANAPNTAEYVMKRYEYIVTPGKGYVEDIRFLISVLKEPFLTVAADLPFLKPAHIREILGAYRGKSVSGVYRGKYVGVNIVSGEEEEIYEFSDPLIEVNINTKTKYRYLFKG